MNWHTELTELLPTKWSRWTAGSSILLAVAAYNLPSLLPESSLGMSQLELSLVRLLLSTGMLLFGSLAVIVLVVRAYNAQAKSHAAKIEAIKDAEKKTEDSMAQQINYPPNGIV